MSETREARYEAFIHRVERFCFDDDQPFWWAILMLPCLLVLLLDDLLHAAQRINL